MVDRSCRSRGAGRQRPKGDSMLIRICAWCRCFMGFSRMKFTYAIKSLFTGKWRNFLTHGICESCREKQEYLLKIREQNYKL